MLSIESRVKEHASALGFDLVGIAPATCADGFDRLREWLDQGFAGEMAYMSRHAEARRHPASILPDVRSVVMVGMNYKPVGSGQWAVGSGRVARYAQGADYHDVLRERLNELLAWLQREVPGCRGRGVVDTAPLLERDFARRAGLGWFGKNTMLLNKRLGSYFFLGALLLDLELQPDPPHETSHCGDCTACLDACPTQAFPVPGQLDSRRCISYLTIELRGPIPEELREPLGDWVFGCDVCQEVCPWNDKAPPRREPAFQARPDLEAVDLVELLGLSEEEFRRRFRRTALMRAKRGGLLRNAAIALGNLGDPKALPALRGVLTDPDPVIREAAQWAIDQIGQEISLKNANVEA
ncbi:MAG TPA: tRNA epoxyqueuosine(34) reductase QueG [Gemmataceae bacterium]|nr:tRNA epoxyqueuosine(34) reductase QueG [Gemmataceae bacterium]